MPPGPTRGLSIKSTLFTQSRKYLGESNDPHFVPPSPLIDRQLISAQDEAELTRLCTLALANVPHSDDMSDDPFRYLGKHILVKTQTRTQEVTTKLPLPAPAKPKRKIPEPLKHVTTKEPVHDDTATPSENSRRETLQTTGSTPMTSPGLTPGEVGKTFGDAFRTLTSSSSSNLRTEIKSAKGNAVYAFLKDPLSSKTRPQGPIATKSLTHLPMTKPKSRQQAPEGNKVARNEPFGTPNFNKSLPAIPRSSSSKAPPEPSSSSVEKTGIFSRLLKTARQQRPQPTVNLQIQHVVSEVAQLSEEEDSNMDSHTRRKRFNITAIFNKQNTTFPKRATVG